MDAGILEGWAAVAGSLSREVAEVFETVSEEYRAATGAPDRFEADRVEARRRYENLDDCPVAPSPTPEGSLGADPPRPAH